MNAKGSQQQSGIGMAGAAGLGLLLMLVLIFHPARLAAQSANGGTVTTLGAITWVSNGIDEPIYDFTANGLSSTPRPDYGSIVTISATVVAQSALNTQPVTGTVAFYVNGTLLPGGSSIPIQNGVATFTTTNLPVGNDTLTATYTPDAVSGFAGSTSAQPALEYVSQAIPRVLGSDVHVIYDGVPHPVTYTLARPELQVASLSYYNEYTATYSTTAPTNAGTYISEFAFTNTNYATSAGPLVQIDHLRGSISLSNLHANYDGSPHSATVTFAPASEAAAVRVSYNGAMVAPSAAGVYQVIAGIDGTLSNYTASANGVLVISAGGSSVWIANQDSTVSHLSTLGALLETAGAAAGNSTFGSIAVDSSGNAWSVVNGLNALSEVSPSGSLLGRYAGGGLNAPVSVAVDGVGQIWVANTNNTLSSFTNYGNPISPGTGLQPAGLNAPSALAIDQTGSLWIANAGSSTITRVLGVAAPVPSPVVNGVTNGTTATRP